MAASYSVVCSSCQAKIKISKASLAGKRVPCPSCKSPVLIQIPATDRAALSDDVPLVDDIPLKDDLPARSAPRKSEALPLSDDLPITAAVPAGGARSGGGIVKPAADAAAKRSSSGADSRAKDRSKKSSSGEVRPGDSAWDSKKFVSQAQSSEFDAMLSDTEESDSLDDEDSPPRPSRRKAGRGDRDAAEVETSEFDSMLADTDEQDEQPLGKSLASRKRKTQPAIPTQLADNADDDLEDLPPVIPRSTRAKGGWRPAEHGPIVVWTCVGAGLCVLLLGYVLFSTRSSGSSSTTTPTTIVDSSSDPAPETETKTEENANASEKQGADTAQSATGEGKPTAGRISLKSKGALTNPASANPAATSEGADDPKAQSASGAGDGEKPPTQATSSPSGSDKDGSSETSEKGQQQSGAAKSAAKTTALAMVPAGAKSATSSGAAHVGRSIAPFSAAAIDNTTFHSADHKEQVLIVAFLGVECPLANLYCPSLASIAKRYRNKSVCVIAVNSNAQDTLERVRSQARANSLTFPVLKDTGNKVADLFGAERTPEFFVLDAERTVRYRGMLDDQYGYRDRRSEPTKTYVIDAVDTLLKSQPVALDHTDVQGCHIGRVTLPSETAKSSYYRDVLPILQKRCQQCHRKGEIGPFAMADYEAVREWGPTIREAVTEHRMPPWPADAKGSKFVNDASLSETEVNAITQWVEEGCPRGDAAEKPAEKKFLDGWNIGQPDKIYSMTEKFHVPATGVIGYKNFYVSPVFSKDTWVKAVECRFGNRTVVHHMLVLLDFPKDKSRSQDGLVKGFFAAGAPGSTYFVFPEGHAKKIPKGARLRFQMHYTPNGTPADDQSKFGVVLAKGNSFQEVQTYALGKPDILIPAGDANHKESAYRLVESDLTLTTFMPHMHVRGKSFTYILERPDGTKETLLSVPKWDFNWQYQYELAEPLTIPKGSKLWVEATWDNSANNPNNFLPLVDARFGEQTFDEMFIGYLNFIPSKPLAEGKRPARVRKRG